MLDIPAIRRRNVRAILLAPGLPVTATKKPPSGGHGAVLRDRVMRSGSAPSSIYHESVHACSPVSLGGIGTGARLVNTPSCRKLRRRCRRWSHSCGPRCARFFRKRVSCGEFLEFHPLPKAISPAFCCRTAASRNRCGSVSNRKGSTVLGFSPEYPERFRAGPAGRRPSDPLPGAHLRGERPGQGAACLARRHGLALLTRRIWFAGASA